MRYLGLQMRKSSTNLWYNGKGCKSILFKPVLGKQINDNDGFELFLAGKEDKIKGNAKK